MAKPAPISEAEWVVMEVLWKKSPQTAAAVVQALKEKKWAANTVRTLLARLVKKGVLSYAEDGNRYLYRATVPREICVQEEVASLTSRVFGGAIRPLLLHFVQNEKLTAGEIAELRAILDGKEPK
jgi:BlaI family penicillinase repressor